MGRWRSLVIARQLTHDFRDGGVRMRRHGKALVVLLVAAGLVGCSKLGPQAISSGRPSYNEAIEFTDNQQIFEVIVKNRFGESAGLMAVASVSANFRVTGSVAAEFGIGDPANFAGNIVPLRTGAAYEDNPTITYTPVAGKDFLNELFGPLPLGFVILMIQGGVNADLAAVMLLKSINGLRNPAYLSAEVPESDPRFLKLAELLGTLQEAELLTLATDGKESYAYVVPNPNPHYQAITKELADLLSLPARSPSTEAYRIPIRRGIGTPKGPEILVQTRSIADLIKIASASMEVPEAQVQDGLALPNPPLGSVGNLIHIRSSPSTPDDALVSARMHGTWYYIAQQDLESKLYFRLLQRLMNARIADIARSNKAAPVLTLPVAR